MNPRVHSPFAMVVLAAAVAACHDYSTPPPPLALPPGELAFVSDRGLLQQRDIYLMGTDGKITNLTPTSFANEGWPSWSPDGTQIAFDSDRAVENGVRHLDVYVMNADGSGVQRLTTDTTNEFEPSWSPDGKSIAFVSDSALLPDTHQYFHIFVMSAADGTGVTALTSGAAFDAQPAWSPDGTRIAFATNRDGNDEIYVMGKDGANPVNVTNQPGATDIVPAWSPDSKKIAFYSDRDGNFAIYVMNADGTGVLQLTTSHVPDEFPAWSPDGRYIVFDSDADLYFINADGSNGPQQLTRGGETDIFGRWRP